MPVQPTRRRSEPNAGPPIVDERLVPTTVPAPAPTPAAEAEAKPRKFTAQLDADTEERFGRLTDALVAAVGRIATRPANDGRHLDRHGRAVRTGYAPSRADLLRALLVVAEDDPTVAAAVHDQVRADFLTHQRTDATT